jgi:hypothetical protein
MIEMVVDGGMNRSKFLQTSQALELQHRLLS